MKKTFDEWKREADAICIKLSGVSLDDLPDCAFRDWYEDGHTPTQAAKKAIRQAEDF